MYSFEQVLIHGDQPETELLWITSTWSQVPFAAIVAGHKSDNRPLYMAKIHHREDDWRAGNYDPDKHCAEYVSCVAGSCADKCGAVWKLFVAKYGKV